MVVSGGKAYIFHVEKGLILKSKCDGQRHFCQCALHAFGKGHIMLGFGWTVLHREVCVPGLLSAF